MTLQDLQTQLDALTLTEKADAIQILTQSLSSRSQRLFEKVLVVILSTQKSPLAPLKKGGNSLKVPLFKGDLGGFVRFATCDQTFKTSSQGITKTPGVMGGDACVANTRLPVWLFVSLRHQGVSDAGLLEAYPHLTAADLVNVWAYADAYPDEIAIALQEQAAVMQEDQ